MEVVRLAAVSYLNTRPLIEGLDGLAGLDFVRAVPSQIASMLRQGDADVGLVSLLDAVSGPEPLTLLPCGVIGCDGPTLTVRVFSAVEPSRITTLHADTDSRTSVVLAQVILDRLHGIRPAVHDFDTRERFGSAATDSDAAWPEAVVLIGDKVVQKSPPAVRYPHQIDLGEAWKGLTGLPFVYACWACRPGMEEERGVQTAVAVLDRQRRRNQARLDRIVAERAPEHGWPPDLARRYLGELLRFDAGPAEREAVERFVAMAADLGLIQPGPLRWHRPAPPAPAAVDS